MHDSYTSWTSSSSSQNGTIQMKRYKDQKDAAALLWKYSDRMR